MKVKDAQFFTVVSSFLNVYLVKNRSCSSNTVKSYEDALNLFLRFGRHKRYSQTTSKLEPFHPPKHTGIRGLVGESQELQQTNTAAKACRNTLFCAVWRHCRSARNCNTS